MGNLGEGLSYIPLPQTQKVSVGIGLFTDALKTGLDYKNMDSKSTTTNLIFRSSGFIVDRIIGNKIQNSNLKPMTKYTTEQGASFVVDESKDALIKTKQK